MTRPAVFKSQTHLRLLPSNLFYRPTWWQRVKRAFNWRVLLMRFRLWRKCWEPLPF